MALVDFTQPNPFALPDPGSLWDLVQTMAPAAPTASPVVPAPPAEAIPPAPKSESWAEKLTTPRQSPWAEALRTLILNMPFGVSVGPGAAQRIPSMSLGQALQPMLQRGENQRLWGALQQMNMVPKTFDLSAVQQAGIDPMKAFALMREFRLEGQPLGPAMAERLYGAKPGRIQELIETPSRTPIEDNELKALQSMSTTPLAMQHVLGTMETVRNRQEREAQERQVADAIRNNPSIPADIRATIGDRVNPTEADLIRRTLDQRALLGEKRQEQQQTLQSIQGAAVPLSSTPLPTLPSAQQMTSALPPKPQIVPGAELKTIVSSLPEDQKPFFQQAIQEYFKGNGSPESEQTLRSSLRGLALDAATQEQAVSTAKNAMQVQAMPQASALPKVAPPPAVVSGMQAQRLHEAEADIARLNEQLRTAPTKAAFDEIQKNLHRAQDERNRVRAEISSAATSETSALAREQMKHEYEPSKLDLAAMDKFKVPTFAALSPQQKIDATTHADIMDAKRKADSRMAEEQAKLEAGLTGRMAFANAMIERMKVFVNEVNTSGRYQQWLKTKIAQWGPQESAEDATIITYRDTVAAHALGIVRSLSGGNARVADRLNQLFEQSMPRPEDSKIVANQKLSTIEGLVRATEKAIRQGGGEEAIINGIEQEASRKQPGMTTPQTAPTGLPTPPVPRVKGPARLLQE